MLVLSEVNTMKDMKKVRLVKSRTNKHQRNECRLMLFLLCQRRRKPGAEQHAEVGDDRRQAFVKDPAHQPHRPPLQQRQRPGQRGKITPF